MPREILPSTPAPTQPAPSVQPSPAAPAQPEPPLPQDALAGALPDWDLLPTSPFVRRVK